jgi:intracellular septation protein
MKLLFDLFPVIFFFIAYKLSDFYIATIVAILASLLQILILWFIKRSIETMYLISAALIIILGLVTLISHDARFFQWKPTVINWAFAIVFLVSHCIGQKPLIQRMMEKNISLPPDIWRRLNLIWVSFFIIMGGSNLYVAYHFDMNTWVNFKLFGILGLTIVFIIIQAIYLARHAIQEENFEKK